jgi:glycogen operon protein
LLLDPNAKAVSGDIIWDDALFGYIVGHEDSDLSFDERDSAPYMPKGVVIDTAFSWDNDKQLRTPWHKTRIYELHVKGFTAQHPDVPPELRGTYAALTLPVVIDYLHSLSVTAVELMPVHYFIDDHYLVERGLRNYWGYNTLGFFAPTARY